MISTRYGSALGTFGEHRRSPNTPTTLQCIWVHLETVFALQMYSMPYHSA